MKTTSCLVACACLCATMLPLSRAGQTAGENITVITSDKLVYDSAKAYALFDGNVVVTDPNMKLSTDKLTAMFDKAQKIKHIKAEGNVTITQDNKTAKAGKATYDVATGKIEMTERPWVRQGKDVLEGGRIIFWRDESRMECYDGARLIIYPGQGGHREQLQGTMP